MQVRLDSAEPNALAAMLVERLEQAGATIGGSGRVSLKAVDIGLSATLEFASGLVSVRNGSSKEAQVQLRSDTASLVELADAPSLLGVPSPFSASGRDVLSLLARRRIRIVGAFRHPLVLLRFSRLMGAG